MVSHGVHDFGAATSSSSARPADAVKRKIRVIAQQARLTAAARSEVALHWIDCGAAAPGKRYLSLRADRLPWLFISERNQPIRRAYPAATTRVTSDFMMRDTQCTIRGLPGGDLKVVEVLE